MIYSNRHNARRAGVLGRTLSGMLLYIPAAMGAPSSDIQGCPVDQPPLSLPADADVSSLTSDQAHLEDSTATAWGDAHMERNGQTLEASHMRYNRDTADITAYGDLKYLRDNLYLTADEGQLNIDKHTGAFKGSHYSVMTTGVRGKADQVRSLGNNQYHLEDADYSACKGPTKAWLLSARHIELDREKGRGIARDATFRLYGIPILYTPYFDFPIDDRRHSGFLPPTIGASGRRGFQVRAPYYLNLAPNYDATIVPHVMSKRGFQLGGQFRYRTQHHKGEINGEILPYDTKREKERDMQDFHHIGKLSPHVGIEARYSRVSDKDYYDDLSNDLASLSTSHLDRRLELTAAGTGYKFSLLGQDFQNLNNRFHGFGGRFDKQPYKRMPQATLNLLSPTAPFQVGLDTQYARFRRDDSVDADRTDIRPKLVWGTDHGGWYANAEAAYRYTHYDLSDLQYAKNDRYLQPSKGNIHRTIPSFEANMGMRFSRTFKNDWVQTLEPRLQYQLVDNEDQSDIPIFDSGNTSMNYNQLFSQNRFTGIDRIADANQLTLGVSSNFISPETGRTVGRIEFGRMTSFRKMQVDMPNSGATGYSRHGSDYVASGMFSPNHFFTGRASLSYDAHNSRINNAIATTTIGPSDGFRLNLGYHYHRDYRPDRGLSGHGRHTQTSLKPGKFETLSQASIGFMAPIGSQVNIIGNWNYSFNSSQNIETLAGVEYSPSCCYSTRLAWRRYVSGRDGRMDNAVMFQFVLRGLGRFGESMKSFVQKDLFSETPESRSVDTYNTSRVP